MQDEDRIIEAGNAKFLNEIEGFTDLPSGCRFNKMLTGSGGTTVALENEKRYVLCMPYVSLINSKMEWCKERGIEALPVHSEGASDQEIRDFKGLKIMATYNSLDRVIKSLGDKVRDYKILIDEYHLLVTCAKWRTKAVNEVLKLYREFGDFVFMTATPTKWEYLPKVLQAIPEVTVSWNNVKPVTVDYTILDHGHLYPVVANIAYKYLIGENEGNAYFFLNSVDSITKLVSQLKKLNATHNDIRIICSKDKQTNNQSDINKAVGKEYVISSTHDNPKRLNFLTSTAFEGCDIFDTNGITYIISDGWKKSTKYDIMTTIPQIIGRIRDAERKDWAKVIFSPSPYFSCLSEKEYSNMVLKNLDDSRKTVETFDALVPKTKELVLESAKDDPYLIVNGNNIELNEYVWCSEMQNYAALHSTYSVIRDEEGHIRQPEGKRVNKINNREYVMNSKPEKELALDEVDSVRLGCKKEQFKDFCEYYHQNYFNVGFLSSSDNEKKQFIDKTYPIIPKALNILGYEKIKRLRFRQADIEAELIKQECLSNPTKVRKLLNKTEYSTGSKLALPQIKADIQEAFNRLGILKIAKATDLKEMFEVKETTTMWNGKKVGAYVIILPK